MDADSTRYRTAASTTLVEVEEVCVLVDVQRRMFYRLNHTAALIWHILEQVDATLDEVARILVQHYPEMPPEEVHRQVCGFVSRCAEQGIIEKRIGEPAVQMSHPIFHLERSSKSWEAPLLVPEGEVECVVGQVTQKLAILNPAQQEVLFPRATVLRTPKYAPLYANSLDTIEPIE